MHLAVLSSTRGTHLPSLTTAIVRGELSATIELVLSNKPDAPILQKAIDAGLPAHFVDPVGLTREQYDEKITQVLLTHHIDLIVLMGYMRILSAPFVARWRHKVINVHPSLLPAFSGLMDLSVHRAVLAAGVPETGCTVHYVTEEVDAGPILLQHRCPVFSNDTAEQLKERVQALEGPALVAAIQAFNL